MRMLSLALVLSFTSLAFAGSPFDQVHQVQTQNEQIQAAKHAEKNLTEENERLRLEAQVQEQRRQQLAAEQNAKRRAAEVSSARSAEAKRQRIREEKFEDEARAIALEDKKLDLEAKKAKVARSNEFIDVELRERTASTDVVQSEADATRNVSSGVKAKLESSGEADVNRSKKWFE